MNTLTTDAAPAASAAPEVQATSPIGSSSAGDTSSPEVTGGAAAATDPEGELAMQRLRIAQLDLEGELAAARSRIAQLEADNQQLRAELAGIAEARQAQAADEEIIRAKMSVGLSREQAMAVINRQKQFDADKGVAA